MKTSVVGWLPGLCSILFLNLVGAFSAYGTAWTPDDLGTQVWLEWRAEDLSSGAVSSWADRQVGLSGTQSNSSYRPVKQSDEVFFAASGDDKLVIPHLTGGYWWPQVTHRAVAILFRIDLSVGGSEGTIFAINGIGGGWEQQPAIKYHEGTNSVRVAWRTPSGSNTLSFPIGENASQWHCLVGRIDGKNLYASVDGKDSNGNYGESVVEMKDWAVPDSNVSNVGYIGDPGSTASEMAIDSIFIMQGTLSRSNAERLTGWALWKKGAQAILPSEHPYRNAAPVSSGAPLPFVESTAAEWDAVVDFWADASLSETPYEGTPIDLTGWVLDFEDEFNTHSVTDDVKGKGAWFAPTHPDAIGAGTPVRPAFNSSDPTVGGPAASGYPDTYIQSSGTMTLRLQYSGNKWYGGSFASVNSNGYGRTWRFPYVEARMKIGSSSTGNRYGAWPALWLKSINYFTDRTETNLEYDIYEGYISDDNGHHAAMHNWAAYRPLSGRLSTNRHTSNYYGLNEGPTQWHEDVDLFDGEYHTYGTMITPEWVINYFDGRELHRFPTPVEMTWEMWVLLDLAIQSNEVSQAGGVYDLTIDYVRVYQNPAYKYVYSTGYWAFDNDASDGSGHGYTASLQNGATYDSDSVEGGNALSLDGTNDYVLLSPDYGSGELHEAFEAKSVFCWIKPDSSSGTQIIYEEGGSSGGIALRINSGNIEAGVTDGSTLETVSAALPAAGVWTAVAVVYEDDVLTLYINGNVAGTPNDTGLGEIPFHTSATAVGSTQAGSDAFGGTSGNYFGGLIDELSVFPSALTATEIAELSTASGSLLLTPTDDALTRGGTYASQNFGSDPQMGSKNGASDVDRRSYLKFDLTQIPSGQTPSAVTLRLWVDSCQAPTVHAHATSDSWSESTITWSTQPGYTSTKLDEISFSTANQWVEFDVTAEALTQLAGDGTLSLAIINDHSQLAFFSTKEGAHPPELYVEGVGGVTGPIELEPMADSYIRGGTYSSNNYGTENELATKNASSDLDRRPFLKFDLSQLPAGTTVNQATLAVYVAGGSGADNRVHFVSDDSWTESGITWSNAPSFASSELDEITVTTSGDWALYDVTSAVQAELAGDEVLSLTIQTDSSQLINYSSWESGTSPLLIIE